MKFVEYLDVPARCDELLDEVEAGTVFQVMKDGMPMLRIEPVEEAAGKKSAKRTE